MPLLCGWRWNFKSFKRNIPCEGIFINTDQCCFHGGKIYIQKLLGREVPELSPWAPFYPHSLPFFHLQIVHLKQKPYVLLLQTIQPVMWSAQLALSASRNLCWGLLEQAMGFLTIVLFVREAYWMPSVLDMLRERSEGKLLSCISF